MVGFCHVGNLLGNRHHHHHQVFQSKAEEDDRRINQLEKDLKEAREKAEAADATYEEVKIKMMIVIIVMIMMTVLLMLWRRSSHTSCVCLQLVFV